MMKAGDVYESPTSRETGVILVGAGDTEGRFMQSETRIRPGGAVSVEHYHPTITERFEVLEGELSVRLDGREKVLRAGESVTVERGQRHRYWNASDADTVFRFEGWPAARFEAMVLTLFALAAEGRTNAAGVPGPLQMAVILDEFSDVMRLAKPPEWVQRLVIPVLARIGRARGMRATYPHHETLYEQWQRDARAQRAREGAVTPADA